ncbi:AAA domain-containing protein [Cytobacillus sp. NCCP-133]|uniref:AAA domain-containing protein n=1 Tax=Cytobacillus sp. NCCP-133 TaxID=766848 RepID=UPI00222F9C03|nr:AAA domain-containing protein [Cytobacillus sp. NCCP-133]GLB60769.1 disulfide oxidoreductase [Cytobacillus sp. NCCP-133]
MTSTITYIRNWQKAILAEILHLKKYGSSRYLMLNGQLLSKSDSYTYFFDIPAPINVPKGATIKVEWGTKKVEGRILSAEGNNVILALEEDIGIDLTEAQLLHDPWELLDQLYERLEDIRESKRKRARIKKLLDPSMPANHPADKVKTPSHELILRSKYNPVTYIWGPPGTGKTYTLARVAANKYFKDQSVLILAHSNQAIDVLMAEISTFASSKRKIEDGEFLRYGSQIGPALIDHQSLTADFLLQKDHSNLSEKKAALFEERRLLKKDLSRSFSKRDSDQLIEIEKKLSGILEKIKKREIEFVKNACVIGTTLAKAASDPVIYEKDFDLVILDEASMAYVPQAAFAASLGKRVIICGDFKQLPPIAASRHKMAEKWLREDIFHHSGVSAAVNNGHLHPHLFLLKEQRRMHPEISAFSNKHIYHSLVGDHKDVLEARASIAARVPFPGRASILLNTAGSGHYGMKDGNSNSRINLWNLLLSFQLIHETFLGGGRSIGYVTPYRAQALLMEQLLSELYEKERAEADIIAATVHRFQGSEREVMIFDAADSFPHERAGMLLTGKDSEKLLNVAITRTKGKFMHICDLDFIQKHVYKNKIWRQLADHQLQNGQAVDPEQIGRWIKNQHARLQWMHARKREKVYMDLSNAQKEIVISLPVSDKLDKEWEEALSVRSAQAKLTLLTKNNLPSIKPDRALLESLSFPFILIDGKVLWLGMPAEAHKNAMPPYVAARLDSAAAGTFLKTQLNQRN